MIFIFSCGFLYTVFCSITGVVLASIGSGMGEFTFLSLTAYFDRLATFAVASIFRIFLCNLFQFFAFLLVLLQ